MNSEVGSFVVSTVFTSDCGYETAIFDYADTGTVVERYENSEKALIGHEKWVEFIKSGKREVVALGYGKSIPDKNVILKDVGLN